MAIKFDEYKKRRKNVNDLVQKIKDANETKKKDYTDDRIYKYTKDKSGNAFAVIRFLPSNSELGLPVVHRYRHAFQTKGRWFIDNCPTSVKGKCYVCEQNNYWWRDGATQSENDIGRKRARKKEYYANIYVVKDSANSDLEGKVMIWKFGQKVYDKIMSKIKPEFEDETPIDIFDLFEGANFKLKIKTVKGYSNYDDCEFMTPAPLFEDEGKLKETFEKIYDLSEFVDEKNFKSYEEIKKKYENVVGTTGVATTLEEKETDTDTTVTAKTVETKTTPTTETDTTDDDGDDDFWDDIDND